MPRINPLQNDELDSATAETLSGVAKKLGMVPNLFATLAHAPAALNSYLNYSDNLSKGALTNKQRETIALAVAQYNQCQYCLSAHHLIGKGAGLSEEDIAKARNGQAENALDNAIASFAREVTQTRGVVSNTTFKTFSEQGLTHSLMVEIVANVALNLLTNYVNHLAETEIDFPEVDLVNQHAA